MKAKYRILASDEVVARWLEKYTSKATRSNYLYAFGEFLTWVRAHRWLDATPTGLIHRNLENIYKSDVVDVARKREATDWISQFIKRGGATGEAGNSYRKGTAAAIFSFYKRNDSPLFGDFKVPIDAYEEPKTTLISLELAKKFISILPLRAKLAALIEFQSGLRICDIVHLKWKQLMMSYKREGPAKIEGLRNDSGHSFYTFLGKDAMAILEIYLRYRRSLVNHDITPEEYILVTDTRPVDPKTSIDGLYVQRQIRDTALNAKFCERQSHGVHSRYNYRTHVFRHLFKTECAHAGINPMISEFFMGHDKGIEYVYNHQHELHPEDFIKLYQRVEPFLSISTHAITTTSQQEFKKLLLDDPTLRQDLKTMILEMDEWKTLIETELEKRLAQKVTPLTDRSRRQA